MTRMGIAVALGLVWCAWSPSRADESPSIEKYLAEGKLAEGEKTLEVRLNAAPDDGKARFGLGVVQFVRGVERMVQSFHRYGLRTSLLGNALPFERLPIPENAHPEPIGYEELRPIFQTWVDDLARAEATLAQVRDDQVKLPIRIGELRLDFNGDGKADAEETLWRIFAEFNRAANDPAIAAASKEFVIVLDRADVSWLRGYCHLLMAYGEVYLAHDCRELFDHTGPLFFGNAKSAYPFLQRTAGEPGGRFEFDDIVDAVAFIHLIRLPVVAPQRLTATLSHLESMIALSRESWKFILAETDDDHEWVPSPKQHTVIPGLTVTDEMVKGWKEFLDEAESLLQGKKLVPFWRAREARGVNLHRVFTEPRTFDLVLWVQGTAAAPYLENGPQTSAETWRRLQRVFQGEFIGFALWFN
ncbi:hypothetical protein [Paludisphaera borealis]|uniref:Uncharacterized protein n=1 Tax=Paludisphaera borealis TaxID=1387353 RepID=A0A1U7CKH1_9BACT|nr:hypothetical protein [Paludisphaera borealis]APW59435.1 hypothetical protein BSF38_00858 [Paludisphaera borealis]